MSNIKKHKKEVPIWNDYMPEEQKREFINYYFDLYEKEEFAKVFWSKDCEFRKYNDQPFKVLGRATEDDTELEFLPMWRIEFEDGESILVSEYEIFPSQMIKHGCKLKVI